MSMRDGLIEKRNMRAIVFERPIEAAYQARHWPSRLKLTDPPSISAVTTYSWVSLIADT